LKGKHIFSSNKNSEIVETKKYQVDRRGTNNCHCADLKNEHIHLLKIEDKGERTSWDGIVI
jgi:hypothetical protein